MSSVRCDASEATDIPLPSDPQSRDPVVRHELHVLRQRYFGIRAAYLAITRQAHWPADDHRLKLVLEQVVSANSMMETSEPDILAISTALSVADRQLVWRYADHVVRARSRVVREQLEGFAKSSSNQAD